MPFFIDDFDNDDKVPEYILRKSDLSWEERQLVEFVRARGCTVDELIAELKKDNDDMV